jgi:hypothetical protein
MESSGRITHAPERREIKGNRRGDNHTSGGVPEAEEHVARKTVWLLRRGRYLLESGRGFRLLCHNSRKASMMSRGCSTLRTILGIGFHEPFRTSL